MFAMTKLKQLKIWISNSFLALLLTAGGFAIYAQDWMNLFLVFLTLLLTFLPDMIEKRYKVDFPTIFEVEILIFIIISMYLGEIREFYFKIWWWDLLLHSLSGVILGTWGFATVYMLNKHKRISLDLNPAFLSFFAFCFALAVGVLWEIFEFGIDVSLGTNMQKSGLVDTMSDLIVNVIGAGIVCLLGFLDLKYRPQHFKSVVKLFTH